MSSGPVGRADEMVAFQRERRAGIVASVRRALTELEAEIKGADGQGAKQVKLSRAEVCRRAGIGESTLKNASHTETRAFVDKELGRLKKLGGPERSHARAPDATHAVARFNQNKVLAIQLDAAMRDNDSLRAENARLRARLSSVSEGGRQATAGVKAA